MDEIYTCVCGGQSFKIREGSIRCVNCSRIYDLCRYKRLNGEEAHILQLPKDFNKRIRKED